MPFGHAQVRPGHGTAPFSGFPPSRVVEWQDGYVGIRVGEAALPGPAPGILSSFSPEEGAGSAPLPPLDDPGVALEPPFGEVGGRPAESSQPDDLPQPVFPGWSSYRWRSSPSPYEDGDTLFLHPSAIGFSHDSISPFFQDGRKIASLVRNLGSRRKRWEEVPPLKVYLWGGRFYSKSNRRLAAARVLAQTSAAWRRRLLPVKYSGLRFHQVWKHSTRNLGRSVQIRWSGWKVGGADLVVSTSFSQSSWTQYLRRTGRIPRTLR